MENNEESLALLREIRNGLRVLVEDHFFGLRVPESEGGGPLQEQDLQAREGADILMKTGHRWP